MVYLIDLHYKEPREVYNSVRNLIKGRKIFNPRRETVINSVSTSPSAFILSHGLKGKLIFGREKITPEDLDGNKVFAMSCWSYHTLKNSDVDSWAGFKNEILLPENPKYVASAILKSYRYFLAEKEIKRQDVLRMIKNMDRESALLTVWNLNRLYTDRGKIFNLKE